MALISDIFRKGFLFLAATGEKSGANLEDLVTRAVLVSGTQMVDQVTIEDYEDTGLQDDFSNNLRRLRVKDGGITLAKLAAAVTATLIPAGTIIAFASETPPSEYLECDGSAQSRSTYADLYAVTGDVFGEGDGATTFNLPDFRGQFLRGFDNGAAADPDVGSRTAMATGGATGDAVGSVQGSEQEAHQHETTVVSNSPELPANFGHGPSRLLNLIPDGTTRPTRLTSSTGGNETRPVNASVMFCIKT